MTHPLFEDDQTTELANERKPREKEDDQEKNAIFRITVVTESNPKREQGAAISITIDGTTLPPVVGKSAACALILADHQVSRRHASFDIVTRPSSPSLLSVTDLGSTNGTYVNGVRIAEAFLQGGELITLGSSCVLRVERLVTKPPPIAESNGFGRIIGASMVMRRLYPLFQRLAAADIPVVIEGETGTGKELLAETLHELGARRAGPFVVFDCGAIAAKEVEAMLFGDERTGSRGVFEQAHQGTLLIDEVTELPIELQSKLLRAIERGAICRLGSDHFLRVDVRIITTTRRSLENEVEANRLREDLFFRLAVGRVELPPLRQRHGDEKLLLAEIAKKLGHGGGVPADFLRHYEGYAWPGNVRELQNALARRLVVGDADVGSSTSSSSSSASGGASDPNASPEHAFRWILEQDLPFSRARELVNAELERLYVSRVLEQHGGNISRAAAASGLARRYFQILRNRLKGDDSGS